MALKTRTPWKFLDAYRGKASSEAGFKGEWPTLPEMLKISTNRYGERPCITIYEPDRISLSYKAALAKIEAVARYLHNRGIGKGDTVAVTGKNSPEWTVAYFGVLFAGATVAPIDYQIKNEETDLLLKTAKTKILFIDEEKYKRYADSVPQRSAGSPGALIPTLTEVLSLKNGVGTYIYTLDGPAAEIEQATEHDLAAILFTSGTTGKPKGVILTHRNLVSDC